MKRPTAPDSNTPKAEKRSLTTLVCLCICVAFAAFLALHAFLFLVVPDKAMSENENRTLQQKPKLTLSAVADGSFMKKYETYLTDQFPGRDGLISMHSFFATLTGRREENGVLLGRRGFLFERQTPLNEELLQKTTDAINDFLGQHRHAQAAMILAPNSSYVLKKYLPYHIRMDDQKAQLSQVKAKLSGEKFSWISVLKSYEKVEDPTTLYYRTDHHWTTDAALRAFLALSGKWELGAKEKHFTVAAVSDRFSGTLAASYGDRKLRDVLKVCIPNKSEGTYAVHYESQNKTAPSVFDRTKLDQKNQYEVFLGGNFDKIVIQTLSQTEDTLLLFKDSYANCLIPMLTPYFSKIVIIDPRYFSDSLQNITDDNDFTHILFVYNLNTFLADKSLAGVLAS
ncbi:MAG: hypothetical protein II621_10365 [Clostridia bacterium]|jgi:hypothetical protein|nr:hypothetical protein [Clostridia bacterium]MBQ4365416.1 hypothetical protein [Clostridia bacterium]